MSYQVVTVPKDASLLIRVFAIFLRLHYRIQRFLDKIWLRPAIVWWKKDVILQMVIRESFYKTIEVTAGKVAKIWKWKWLFVPLLFLTVAMALITGFVIPAFNNLDAVIDGAEASWFNIVNFWPLGIFLLGVFSYFLFIFISSIYHFEIAEWERYHKILVMTSSKAHIAMLIPPGGSPHQISLSVKDFTGSERSSPGEPLGKENRSMVGKLWDGFLSNWSYRLQNVFPMFTSVMGGDVGRIDLPLRGIFRERGFDFVDWATGTAVAIERIADTMAKDISDAKMAMGKAMGYVDYDPTALHDPEHPERDLADILAEMAEKKKEQYMQYLRLLAQHSMMSFQTVQKLVELGNRPVNIYELQDPEFWDRRTGLTYDEERNGAETPQVVIDVDATPDLSAFDN